MMQRGDTLNAVGRSFLGWRVASLLLLSVVGCGGRPPVPSEFTVSGKPLEFWLTSLESRNEREREKAVQTLSNVGTADPKVVPALIAALEDKSAVVRGKAALALLKIGPDANASIESLTKVADNDSDPVVRDYAAKAVAKVRGEQ